MALAYGSSKCSLNQAMSASPLAPLPRNLYNNPLKSSADGGMKKFVKMLPPLVLPTLFASASETLVSASTPLLTSRIWLNSWLIPPGSLSVIGLLSEAPLSLSFVIRPGSEELTVGMLSKSLENFLPSLVLVSITHFPILLNSLELTVGISSNFLENSLPSFVVKSIFQLPTLLNSLDLTVGIRFLPIL